MTIEIGTEIYYTGDMANASGTFKIAGYALAGWVLEEVGGTRRFRVYYSQIGRVYNGTCSPRFVTQAARKAYVRERLPNIETLKAD